MAEEKRSLVPITESEYKIIEQIVRSRPGNARLSDAQLQDLILKESLRVMEARDQARATTRGPFRVAFDQLAQGKPPRTLSEVQVAQIAADVKAKAPEGLTTQELINLTEQAVHQAAWEGKPPGPASRAITQGLGYLEPFITPNLPENPVDILPGHLQQRYRRNQLEAIQQAEANLPGWLAAPARAMIERDRPYPPTPGDVIPLIDPYNLARMSSDFLSLATSGLGGKIIKGLRTAPVGHLPGGGGAATRTAEELAEARRGITAEREGPVRGGLRDAAEAAPAPETVYRFRDYPTPPPEPTPPTPPPTTGAPAPTRTAEQIRAEREAIQREREGGRRYERQQAEEEGLPGAVEEPVARTYRVEGPALRDRPKDPAAVATQEALDDFSGAPERLLAGEGAQGATTPLPATPASVEGALRASPEAGTGALGLPPELEARMAAATADPELRVALQNVLEDFDARRISREDANSTIASLLDTVEDAGQGFARTAEEVGGRTPTAETVAGATVTPEAVGGQTPTAETIAGTTEEVVKTRTRPGSPHGHTSRVAGFNAPGERLPLISQAEADRIAANREAIEARHVTRNEETSRAFGPEGRLRPGDEPRVYEGDEALTETAEAALPPARVRGLRAAPGFSKTGAVVGGTLGGIAGAGTSEAGGEEGGFGAETLTPLLAGAFLGGTGPKAASSVRGAFKPYGWDVTRGLATAPPRRSTRLFSAGAGALGGAALGQNAQPGREGEASAITGAVGGALGYQLPRELQLLAKGPLSYFDKARRGNMLAGWAIPKSIAGSVTAVPWALAEQTVYGHPIEAGKNLFRSLKSIPKGYEEAKGVMQSGHAPAYALLHPEHAPPAEGIASAPGRTMGVFDAFARNALLNMKNPITGVNYTPDEAATYLLSGKGKSTLGAGTLDLLSGRTGNEFANYAGQFLRHTKVPVGAGTSVNTTEQGLQRLPFGLNLLTEVGARNFKGLKGLEQTPRELFGNTVLGTGAFLGGQATEAAMDPESARTRQMFQAAMGKYGLPFGMGMARQRNQELDEAKRLSPAEVLTEATFQESPAKGPRFNENFLADYMRTVPGRSLYNRLFGLEE